MSRPEPSIGMQPATIDRTWRDKYYDSLDALERREREWDEVEQTLYRSLARLSLTGYGVDDGLDRRIDQLRESLRARRSADLVAELVERIEESAQLQRSEAGATAPCESPTSADGPSLFSRLLSTRGRGRGRGSSPKTRVDVTALMQFLDGLHRSGTIPALPSRSARRRLAASTDTDQLRSALDELVEELSATHSPPNSESDANTDSNREVRTRVVVVLARLLEQLESTISAPERAAALREQLMAEPEIGEIPNIIAAITRLVSESAADVRSEREDMERFLSGLNHRLDELNGWIDTRAESDRDAAEARDVLDQSVSSDLEGMREAVDQAQELGVLKREVHRRVEAVELHLSSHLEMETRRQDESDIAIERLRNKLEETEAQRKRLGHQLEHSQVQALRDSLTGIANRTAFDERLNQELARSRRTDEPLALALWDVDRFKQVNDRFGHPAGDKVLRAVAQRLAKGIRESDFIARYGGEEFALLLPNTSLESSLPLMETLRAAVEQTGFRNRGEPVAITASCGVAIAAPDEPPVRLIKRADEALYRAKDNGRNRIEPA